jgi:hypothetical protein
MTAVDDAAYRLRLAEDLLARARRVAAVDAPSGAMLARAAIENAAKAVLACFTSVARSHEPEKLLAEALAHEEFPAALGARARALVPHLASYGAQTHAQTAYGDEVKHRLPSEIIGDPEARAALRVADDAVALARDGHGAVFGG